MRPVRWARVALAIPIIVVGFVALGLLLDALAGTSKLHGALPVWPGATGGMR